jgi:hypothetical protein
MISVEIHYKHMPITVKEYSMSLPEVPLTELG